MTPWINRTLHDWAGGIIGGMGGTVFGYGGCVVGYVCGAYLASSPLMYLPPPDVPDFVNPQKQDAINHNLLLSLRYQRQLFPKEFSFVIKDVSALGYKIPDFIDEDFLKSVFERVQTIDYSNQAEIKKFYYLYNDSPSMKLLGDFIDKIYEKDFAFDEFMKELDSAQEAANGVKDLETPLTLLQMSLGTIRTSGYFWYMGFHS